MKPRVAVLQFPGINSEYETLRALWDAQIDAEFFRWNDDASKLSTYDGFVVPGGFSYEDRGRSGLIASMDPVMQEIARQADSGKPVLGICNGAQILVETGLVPGGKPDPSGRHTLLMSLARNKRVQNGKVIGVGFYNTNVHVKSVAPQGRTAFTLDFSPDELSGLVPIAHGEGRFTTSLPGLLETLRTNHQIVFKYCDASGQIGSEFPLNPNGALDSAAAICNPQGNVMAIMPHPERAPSAPMPKIFSSMCKYMQARAEGKNPLVGTLPALDLADNKPALETHAHTPGTLEFFIELIITDNEAQTLENALRQNGFDVRIRKWKYYEIATSADQDRLATDLIASGDLCNLNKERVTTVKDGTSFPKKEGAAYFLIWDTEDAEGLAKGARLGLPVKRGWFWEVTGTFDEAALLATNIFANHHAQVLKKF